MIRIEDIKAAARGGWRDLFAAVGINVRSDKRHGPCPICGGKDRFRCDDKDGDGSWICNQCGAGDGFELVKRSTNDTIEAINILAGALGIRDADQDKIKAIREKSQDVASKSRAVNVIEKATANISAQKAALWLRDNSDPASADHPYLIKKGIKQHTAWQNGDELIILIVNWNREIVSAQRITTDKKLYLKGGMKIGCFHPIGRVLKGDTVAICEGWATGATIREATGYPVIVAFDSGNLPDVSRCIKHLYPSNEIIICGDNDHHLPPSNNAGVLAAVLASNAAGCDFVLPPAIDGVSDFNDLYLVNGIDSVKAAITKK